jgi:hypothetical protein
MEITKREILVSIAIVCIMILFGVLISAAINTSLMEKYQDYNTALQIESDKDLFEYGMRTNIGNAFVYGGLKAVDTVTYEEIGGAYSYVEKVKERYTMHTRTVTKTRTVNGKTQSYTTTETYWTWDRIDSWSKNSEKIAFLGVEFDYGTIKFPPSNYITTIKESGHIRYKYYGAPTECEGTLYAKLGDNTITNVSFYNNTSIDKTIDMLQSNWQIVLFWIGWVLLTGGLVVGFYFIDNKWLEDKEKTDGQN